MDSPAMTKTATAGKKKGLGPEESGGVGLLRMRTRIVPLRMSMSKPV
jgi:hypothetical protein